MTTTYTAIAVRDGSWWAIEILEVPGVFTQARRLDQVEAVARSALALRLQVDESGITVTVAPKLPTELASAATKVKQLRQRADVAAQASTAASRRYVRTAQRSGLTQRDIAASLGITTARVNQILKHSPKA